MPRNMEQEDSLIQARWKAPRADAIAGIAFLWFIGVLRDRLGAHEDRFVASVFLGSGLLFLGLLFVSWAVAGGIIMMHGTSPGTLAVRTGIFPRWMAYLGYGLALALLLCIGYLSWALLVFPLWVLLISIHILLANLDTKQASNQ